MTVTRRTLSRFLDRGTSGGSGATTSGLAARCAVLTQVLVTIGSHRPSRFALACQTALGGSSLRVDQRQLSAGPAVPEPPVTQLLESLRPLVTDPYTASTTGAACTPCPSTYTQTAIPHGSETEIRRLAPREGHARRPVRGLIRGLARARRPRLATDDHRSRRSSWWFGGGAGAPR